MRGKCIFSKEMKSIVAMSLLAATMCCGTYSKALAADEATLDVTPPWGRLEIVGATAVNNINYVERTDVDVKVYAADDMCADNEIQYYISTSEIADTAELPEDNWKNYSDGVIENITLPNTTSTNVLYAVFRDKSGNTSLIYNGTNVQYTVEYDANGGTEAPTGTTAYYGMSFFVTKQTPKRDGYYFLGWSTNELANTPSYRAGEIAPASVFKGGSRTIKLFAIWTTDVNALPKLADVAQIGDYVNYPVYYDNVTIDNKTSTLKGWRVISKDVNLSGESSPGTVNLVSAGTPLSFQGGDSRATILSALLENFLTTPFGVGDQRATYRLNGFAPFKSLTEIFTNEFTETKADGSPKVRSMVAKDISRIAGEGDLVDGKSYADSKYDRLFEIGTHYWLASAYSGNSYGLWYIGANGRTYNYSVSEPGVRPVVSLKSNVLSSGTDMSGAWNIVN